MKIISTIVLFALLYCTPGYAGQPDDYDYFEANRVMIRNGVQAVLTCNGLFTSHRTKAQVFRQELAYHKEDGDALDHGEFVIDEGRQAVGVGGPNSPPVIRAAFRQGIGCIVMAPDQTFDDIDLLPLLETPPLAGDPARIAWPNGDVVPERLPLPGVDEEALLAASRWAFHRETPEQDTLSLIVVHKGDIVHERYADGVDMLTRTRTWSTAKSIAVTLIGMLVDEGSLDVDAPLGFDWLPELRSPETDPRDAITLRHVLNMSSGLYPVDSFRREYVVGSGLAYWAGLSSVTGATSRALVRAPGTFWDYENYDTLLAVLAMKRAIGDEKAYLEFPRKRLFDKLGMRNTLASTDRFGDFVMSSQIYTNARDLARFGLLYLQGGAWDGERLVSEAWIEFVRRPAPATRDRGNHYGGQWWLVPDDRDDVPGDAYSTSGNRGQYVIVVPSHDIVIVRRGLDHGRQGFNRWDLTREVLKAIKTGPAPGASP